MLFIIYKYTRINTYPTYVFCCVYRRLLCFLKIPIKTVMEKRKEEKGGGGEFYDWRNMVRQDEIRTDLTYNRPVVLRVFCQPP